MRQSLVCSLKSVRSSSKSSASPTGKPSLSCQGNSHALRMPSVQVQRTEQVFELAPLRHPLAERGPGAAARP
jgi:hypothetical protein